MSDASDPPADRAVPAPRPDRRLLEILVCPLTKGPLVYHEAGQELISRKAGLAFPIRNGVPLMTREAARPLTNEEFDQR